MNRVPLLEPALLSTTPISFGRGWRVEVRERGSETLAPVFAAEEGSAELTQPLTTDADGRPKGAGGELPWLKNELHDLAYFAPGNATDEPNAVVPWGQPRATQIVVNRYGTDLTTARQDAEVNIWVGEGQPENVAEDDLVIDLTGISIEDIEGLGEAAAADFGTEAGTAAEGNDPRITGAASKAYVDSLLAASDVVQFKGTIDCSANPNYPAADAGHLYIVSVAGKIGGAAGIEVEAGDLIVCKTDGTAAGTQAAVGAKWAVIQTNIVGAVTGPAAATSGDIAAFNGASGKIITGAGSSATGRSLLTAADAAAARAITEAAAAIHASRHQYGGADALILPQYDRDLGLPGFYAPMGTWFGATIGPTASRAYFMRFVPSRDITLTKLNFGVTTAATANDKIDVGIYDAELKTRLASSGEKESLVNAANQIRRVSFTSSVKLTAGTVYFAAFAYGAIGGTVAQIGAISNNNALFGDLPSNTVTAQRLALIANTAFPLPAGPITITGAAQTPFVFVGE